MTARDQNIITIMTQHKTKFRHLWAHTKCQGKNLSELTAEEKKTQRQSGFKSTKRQLHKINILCTQTCTTLVM